jgi:hypothetical protein
MRRNYVVVSGLVFGLVAVAQALRALNHWSLQVGTVQVPVWASWVACLIATSLCVWAFGQRKA